MSKLLRLPFALLAVLVLFLLSPGIAAAETTPPPPDDCSTVPAPADCGGSAGNGADAGTGSADGVVEPKDEVIPAPAPADSALQATGVMDDVAALVAANKLAATAQGTDGESTANEGGTNGGTGTAATDTGSGDQPDPAAVGSCIGAVLQKLITDLQAQFGDAVDGLIGDITEALADPTKLPAVLAALPAMGQDAIAGLTEDGQTLLAGAAADIQKCIPAPPSGGSTPPPNNPPVQQPVTQPVSNDTYYANCDDARAHGASNIPVGSPGYRKELDRDNDGYACDEQTQLAVANTQPTQTLAYTGVDVWSLVRLSLILVSGGTLILLAGVRRPQ